MILANSATKALKVSKFYIGMFLSELGGGVERLGSRLTEDRAYLQQLPRHRNIFPIFENKPNIDYSFVAENSTLAGEVFVSSYASVWYNAVLRAEYNAIRIGSYSSVGDSTVIYTANATPT